MTSFSKRVYDVTAQIPYGKVATYGQIARLSDNPRAARAVGALMRCNTNPKHIPCHRVVGANGSLVGYALGGISAKRKKLISEGVLFHTTHVDLSKSLWIPKMNH